MVPRESATWPVRIYLEIRPTAASPWQTVAMAGEFEFVSRPPSRELLRFVESMWYARGTVAYRKEKIAPTGSTVAVFVLGDPILQTPDDGRGHTLRATSGFLVGPHDRPAVNEPTGETHAVGIVTTPIGCEAVFGVPAAELKGRAVDLEWAWSAAGDLRHSLLGLDEPAAMLDLIDHHLAESVNDLPAGLDRCERAVQALESDPTRPIAEIATELEVSHGHLNREFTRIVGLSPRSLAGLLRMRRLLASIDIASGIDWSVKAAELGWYDQAHLIRHFKRHTGVTPSDYLEAQRRFALDETGVPGFVPEA